MKSVLAIVMCVVASLQLSGQSYYYPPNFSFEWETVSNSELGWCDDEIEEMKAFHAETNTNAFIILKNGQMAMEMYFDDHEVTTPWYWASAGKTLTATLVGVAQTEGLIDINKPTSTYLGDGWTSCTPDQESEITVRHQLTMTTGLDYLTLDQNCTEPECLVYLNAPEEDWYYHNAPYTLLTNVIVNASEQEYTEYTNERLASKIGFIGFWLESGDNHIFYSTARGMARFGLLMLSNGDWDGEVVLDDKSYLQKSINASQSINESYGYLWWLNGKESYRLPGSTFTFDGAMFPDAPDDLYAAIGKNGQICIVVPSQDLVIVRMGDNPDGSLVPLAYVKDVWSQYAKLDCSSSIDEQIVLDVRVWPRVTSNYLHFSSGADLDRIDVLDRSGRIVMSVGDADRLDVSRLTSGIYFAHMISESQSITKRFFKVR